MTQAEERQHRKTVKSLQALFYPKSIAVIGASRTDGSIGNRLMEALITNHFQGPVFPINPHAEAIHCIRAYPTIKAVPETVDLAIISVPAALVLKVIDDCAERGVKALVVITAGFAEVNIQGQKLQEQLLKKVREYGMRMVGPNCMGLLNTDPTVNLNASFSRVYPPVGPVAMSSQSGALGLTVLALAQQMGLGLSTFVSVGNKADVSSNDLLEYWEEDSRTRVILLYLESFGNPLQFARLARRISRHKPIVVVKGGKTLSGRRAAGSHTAALAASDTGVEALFRQTGIIQAETLEEMFDLAVTLSSQPLPRGRRVAILTNAGGPGILCADACEAAGLEVPEFSDKTCKSLKAFLPTAASISNPVDMIASANAHHYRQAVEILLKADRVDALIVIYIPVDMSDLKTVTLAIEEGVRAGRKAGCSSKPILTCLLTEDGASRLIEMGNEKVPVYPFPEVTGRLLGKIAIYSEWRQKPMGEIPLFIDIDIATVKQICQNTLTNRGDGWLSTEDSRQVLKAMNLPVSAGGVVSTAQEAVALAHEIGFPVVLKLASHQIIHKTEIQGVYVNLSDEEAVSNAFTAIYHKLEKAGQLGAMEGVLIQPMIKGGVEVMVGAAEDPLFGHLIAFGLGGIHIEVLRDVQFRVAPLNNQDAREMIQQIRGYQLLKGYRGHPPADISMLEDVLLRISQLVESIPEIGELDLNPIFAMAPGQGCQIVDARIRVRHIRAAE